MLFFFVLGCVLLPQASSLSLTDDEIFRLPALFKLDKYYECLRKPGDTYCYTNAKLIGNASNDIYRTLVEYSAENLIHFDRTLIHWGICLKHSCAPFLDRSNQTESLEACLNSTLSESYQLHARVESTFCTDYVAETKLDNGDYIFTALVIVLLLLNILGSAYDFYQSEHSKSQSNFITKLLLCFAVRKNWRTMLAKQGTSNKQTRLKSLNAFRTISTFIVILAHSTVNLFITSNNPVLLERMYSQVPLHFFYNGTVVVQTFFIISGCLTMYSSLGNKSKWRSLPKGIANRWLRITPPYAFVMFFVMTWQRHMGDGPFWKYLVEVDITDCYKAWWRQLLYINNYFDNNQCMTHAWYLGADFQLTILGLIIACISGARAQKLAIGAMFVVGLLTPAGHVLMQNLNAIVIVSPEMARNLVIHDPTFNNLYKRGHTNTSGYALGLMLAFLIYNLKDSDIGSHKYKKFRVLFWLLFPLQSAVILSGGVFYIPGIVVPVGVRMLYSSLIKVLFGITVCLQILFTVLKVESAQRSVLNWSGWRILAKITYCAYIVHIAIRRTSSANNDALSRTSVYKMIMEYISMFGLSYLMAVPLWFLVEAPIANIVKTFIFPPKKKTEKTKPVTMAVDLAVSKETLEEKI